jgi:hypothetical protein
VSVICSLISREPFLTLRLNKLLDVKFTRDEVYEKETVLLPFDVETDKIYHFYFWYVFKFTFRHFKKDLKVYINNHLILETKIIPYYYPGNLEWPALLQLSAIDKSITPVVALKSILTSQELEKIYNAGEMWNNSMQVFVKDYQKRLIWAFPDIAKLEPMDINKTAIENFKWEWSKIAISTSQFYNDEHMPPGFKSYKIMLDSKTEDVFYVRLQSKMNNFQKMKIKNCYPEDAEYVYIAHCNLKQYLSSNHMFSILFSFIHSSRGSELIVLCALLHRNPFFLSLLFDLGGIDLLKDMIVEKQLSGLMDEDNLMFLFNIACNEPISTNIEHGIGEEAKIEEVTTTSPPVFPKFNEATMDFLDILILIAKKLKRKHGVLSRICSTIEYLFQEETNRQKFENRYGKTLLQSIMD